MDKRDEILLKNRATDWGRTHSADKWLEEREYCWTHKDLIALLDQLRESSFWPLAEERIQEILEDKRQRRLSECVSALSVGAVRQLLAAGANPNKAWVYDSNGMHTLLWFAVMRGNVEMAKVLLQHGADPNGFCFATRADDSDDARPLDIAEFKKDSAMADLLRNHGARRS